MSILCKNKEPIPFIPPSDVIDNELQKDLGLSNVYNIPNSVDVCMEPFNSSTYYVDGATRPASGTTSGCSGYFTGATSASTCYAVYNLSEIDDFDLTFNFTGGTDYTGYTGFFCYATFPRSGVNSKRFLLKSDSLLTRCFEYSGITGNTLVDTISKSDLPLKDDEYTIKSYDVYYNQICAEGTSIDTFLIESQTPNFNYEKDWYYTTVINPPTPQLGLGVDELRGGLNFIIESKNVLPGQTTVFDVNNRALNNEYLITVNGIALSKGFDYTIDGSLVTLISGELEAGRDKLQIMYFSIPEETLDLVNDNENYLTLDSFIFTGTTTGVTSGNETNFVNYNPTKNRNEIFLRYPADPRSDINLIINGVTLLLNKEYFISSSNPQKLILDPSITLEVGDSISSFYFVSNIFYLGDLGYLRTDTPTIPWSIPNTTNLPSSRGKFLVQVTDKPDTNFNNPIQSKFVDYIFGVYDYELILDPLGATIEDYIYRVIFFKDYVAVFDNNITTRSISDTGSFTLNLEYINNIY